MLGWEGAEGTGLDEKRPMELKGEPLITHSLNTEWFLRETTEITKVHMQKPFDSITSCSASHPTTTQVTTCVLIVYSQLLQSHKE